MEHDNDAVTPDGTSTSIGRRDLLRRGAALGAAATIAGPVVQGLGALPAFAQASPPPRTAEYPSNFQLLFTVSGDETVYGIKWDGQWDRIGSGVSCWDPSTYTDATDAQIALFRQKAPSYNDGGVSLSVDPTGTRGSYVLSPVQLAAAGITIVAAITFDGQYSGGHSGHCSSPVTPDSAGPHAGSFVFSKP